MIENIAAPLAELARERPDAPALILPRGTHRPGPYRESGWTYSQLDAEASRLARGLLKLGLQPGMRVALLVPPGLEFYALTFALFRAGAPVVLIDPGLGAMGLGACLDQAAPDAFIGVTRAHLARLFFGWGRKSIKLRVTVGPRLGWGGYTLSQVRHEGKASVLDLGPGLAGSQAMAAVLFTSGSTGPAKGAVYTHANFAAQVEALRGHFGIRPGEVDIPTFPLFGLFGPALGMTAVIPEMDFTRPALVDPVRIFNVADQYRATNLFGSPALLRRLAFSPEARERKLATLRRVISAGAPVPAAVLRQLEPLLSPGALIHTPYGATEALPVSDITHREILDETAPLTDEGKGVCVGRPVPGMEVRILPLTDSPIPNWDESLALPPGEIGEIAVRGPVVTASYFGRPAHTASHKIHGPSGVWHRMGDVGYLDGRGRVWFCGRKSQRVETIAGTLFTIPCEGVFNAHPAVLRSALVGVPAGGGAEPVLCVELQASARGIDQQKLIEQLLEMGSRHQHTRGIRKILIHSAFPVDVRHNAKIFREKLGPWAARKLGRRA
jgi:acyl-CoA synthetase (AMP-forming)/AMP-acid ligase II